MGAGRLFGIILGTLAAAATAGVVWMKGEPARLLDRREHAWGFTVEPGDVVFQDLDCGPRCDLIRQVTHSPYTHVGIVLSENGQRMVWEALGPVGPTPLAQWTLRGRDEKVAVYRPTAELAGRGAEIAVQVRAMRGLPYDGDYQWDDERIYCSELVAKAYSRALGRDLFPPHALRPGSFGDRGPLIRKMSHGRLTEETPLVPPVDLARSPFLQRLVDEL